MPASASASRIARTWFVGRQYQSMLARVSTSVGAQRTVAPDAPEELLDERGVLVEGAALVVDTLAVPGHPVPRQLRRRDQAEPLVVGLVQPPLVVQERIGPLAAVAGDPGEEHEVVVPAGHVERIELERPEPIDHRQDALRPGRQRARRGKQVAEGEEAAGDAQADGDRLGHRPDGSRHDGQGLSGIGPAARFVVTG